MKHYFFDLTAHIHSCLKKDEHFLANFSGEQSDFVRFNKALIRQAGNVQQYYVDIALIRGQKQICTNIAVTMNKEADYQIISQAIDRTRSCLEFVPDDPYLLYAQENNSSDVSKSNALGDSKDIINSIMDITQGLDFVGIYSSGNIMRGFANSFGQKNWFENNSINVDFSTYLQGDKASKAGYATTTFNAAVFAEKIEACKKDLSYLSRPSKTIKPGAYKAYFSPQALCEIFELFGYGGFSLKSMNTKHSPLLKLQGAHHKLSPEFSVYNNVAEGFAPNFQEQGFLKKNCVPLIEEGILKELLISPRSAMEFKTHTNSNNTETPETLHVAAGKIDQSSILKELGTGIYINNLWYLNFSDSNNARFTGMTRFACLWVENGEIVAPLNVMRFDDSFLRMFGSGLIGLTKQRDLIMDSGTYEERSMKSALLPGALVDGFTLTL